MAVRNLAARELALDVLGAVLAKRVALETAFDEADASGLDPRDRAFARRLATTALRRRGQIAALIDACLERPLPRSARGVGEILTMGICQLLFLETPAHAAVDTTVALAAERGHGPHKKLVNAVLRRIGREGPDMIAAQDAPRLNTPGWLWDSWTAAYGVDTARRIAEAHLHEPPLDLTTKGDPAPWRDRLDATLLATGTLRLARPGAVTETPGYAEGAWWVQDAAAALPARLLGDVRGKRVLDLCAAPGGKTLQLAAAGAEVTAVDRSENRIRRLRENLLRVGLTAETVVADATAWRPPAPADAVLLDAPCSATGTIRRHPDVAYAKTAEDVRRMAALQDRLLDAVVPMVRPGGKLVYCTCSLEPEEGAARIARFLAAGAPFERAAVAAGEIGGWAEALTPAGEVRTLPCHLADRGGMDGFFMVRLRRA